MLGPRSVFCYFFYHMLMFLFSAEDGNEKKKATMGLILESITEDDGSERERERERETDWQLDRQKD